MRSMWALPQPRTLSSNGKRGSPVVGKRILDRGWYRALWIPLHHFVTGELAELLCQNFLRDAGHQLPEGREMPGRFRQPIHDDQLPLATDRGQGSRERTATDRIAPAWITTMVT